MELKDFTPEQIEKASACTTPEEFIELAKSEGVALSDEQIDQISGGHSWVDTWLEGID